MSYDLICYPSKKGEPSAAEAEQFLEDDEAGSGKPEVDRELMKRIAAALVTHDPALAGDGDMGTIAANCIQLMPPEDDLAVDLCIYGDQVSVSLPYWYEGPDAKAALTRISAYLLIIKQVAGYFVYDPQSGEAFDPEQRGLLAESEYAHGVDVVRDIIASETKPWWKLW